MTTGSDTTFDGAGSQDPYERLGIARDASFEAVQSAKLARLREADDDPQARARIEAAYDAVLMERLKERQQGRVSSAARTASQREDIRPAPPSAQQGALRQLPRLPSLSLPDTPLLPQLAPASGRQLWVPLALQLALLGLLLTASPGSAELVLAFSTGVCVVSLQRRQRRLLSAVGWSVVLLAIGLILGGFLAAAPSTTTAILPLTPDQLRGLPAWLLLLLGSLLLE